MITKRTLLDINPTDTTRVLLIFAGIHGNEPGGIEALTSIAARLGSSAGKINGRVLGIAGNIAALAQGKRFLDKDLNRAFDGESMSALEEGRFAAMTAEDNELHELFSLLKPLFSSSGQIFALDLHSTSSVSAPFTFHLAGDIDLSAEFPAPSIYGIERALAGTLAGWCLGQGAATLIVEGGEHDAAQTADNLEAAIWLMLEKSGLISATDFPEVGQAGSLLAEQSAGLPQRLELYYRHAITADDAFKMLPGFKNFAPVSKGQLLAHDRQGEVTSPADGRLFLPLYQALGNDGFFLLQGIQQRTQS